MFYNIKKHNLENTCNPHLTLAGCKRCAPRHSWDHSLTAAWCAPSHYPCMLAFTPSSDAIAHPPCGTGMLWPGAQLLHDCRVAKLGEEKGAGHSGDRRRTGTPSCSCEPKLISSKGMNTHYSMVIFCTGCFSQTLIQAWVFHCPVMAAWRI